MEVMARQTFAVEPHCNDIARLGGVLAYDYSGDMQRECPDVVCCPPMLFAEALTMVLTELAPSQRRDVAARLLNIDDTGEVTNEPLCVALRSGEIRGAAWGQRQSGNIAVFWPPRLATGENLSTEIPLAECVVR
jgi:ribosomal protein S18 acetylase RimI-like enzyme